MGAWDIGKVSTKLSKPIYEISIGISGIIAVARSFAEKSYLRGEDTCRQNFLEPLSHSFLPGYTETKQTWIFFRLNSAPILTNAKIIITKGKSTKVNDVTDKVNPLLKPSKSKTKKIINPNELFELDGYETLSYVDLDRDGTNDLVIWDDGGTGDDLDFHRSRKIYANVGGQWYLLDSDEEHACGC
jgi:hypothetical protein